MAIILAAATDSAWAIDEPDGVVPWFLDRFTGANAAFTGHTPLVGYGWQTIGNAGYIASNRLVTGGGGSNVSLQDAPTFGALTSTTPPSRDYTVSVILGTEAWPDGVSGLAMGVTAREATAYVQAWYNSILAPHTPFQGWSLQWNDGHGSTGRVDVPAVISLGTAYTLTLTMHDSMAWVAVDGVVKIVQDVGAGFLLISNFASGRITVFINERWDGTPADAGWIDAINIYPVQPEHYHREALGAAATTDSADASISVTYLGTVAEAAAATDPANATLRGPQVFTGPAADNAAATDPTDAAVVPYTVAYVTNLMGLALTQYAPNVRASQFLVQVLRTVVIGVFADAADSADADDEADGVLAGTSPAHDAAAMTDLADAAHHSSTVTVSVVDTIAADDAGGGWTDGTAGRASEAVALVDLAAAGVSSGRSVVDSIVATDWAGYAELFGDAAAGTDSADAPTPRTILADAGTALDVAEAVMRLPASGGKIGLVEWSGYDGEFPFCFCECPGGIILIANGINPVLRWHPITKQVETAGVIPPATGVTLVTDRTRLCPVDQLRVQVYDEEAVPPGWKYREELTDERWGEIIVAILQVDPAVTVRDTFFRWFDGRTGRLLQYFDSSLGPDGQMVYPDPYVVLSSPTIAAGAWLVPARWGKPGDTYASAGDNPFYTYRAYVRFLDRWGNPSDLSPLEATVEGYGHEASDPWAYEDVATPADPKVVRREIYRTVAGTFQTVYLDISTEDLTSTTFTSTKDDAALTAGLPLALVSDAGDIIANVFGVPPAHKSALCHHLGRVFAAVDVDYAVGCVSLAYGSATVTGIGTRWISTFAGRVFFPGVLGESYEIASVDEAAQTLTLLRPYLGATAPYLEYAIRPSRDQRRTIYYTEAGLPQGWPAWNGITLPEDHDDLTGLMSYNSFLYIFERKHIYRFTFQSDPATDGGVFLSTSRGVANNRCWTIVEGACYALDEQGVHKFSGGEEAEPISEPVQDLFRGGGRRAINWEADRRYWHAAHDPRRTTIRWFVSMGRDARPRDALAFNYRAGKWWVESYPYPVTASVELEQGFRRSMLGLEARELALVGESNLDLFADAANTSGTVYAAGPYSLEGVASLPAGVVGKPVAIAAGRGAGQVRTVIAVDEDSALLDRPWTILPDDTSTYQFGGIPWSWRSGWFDVSASEDATVRDLTVTFRPTKATGELGVSVYFDHAEEPEAWGFSKHDDGLDVDPGDTAIRIATATRRGNMVFRWSSHQEAYGLNEQFMSVALAGVSIAEPVAVYSVVIAGVEEG